MFLVYNRDLTQSSSLKFIVSFESFLADLLEYLGSFMIMFLGHSLNEPMRMLPRNGSWLLLVFNILSCE